MFGKALELFIKNRFVTTRFSYGALQVIRTNNLRNAAIAVQRVFAGKDKVFFTLAPYGFHISQKTTA